MKKKLLFLILAATLFTACGNPKEKETESAGNTAEEKNNSQILDLVEEESLDDGVEYCFEFQQDSISQFANDVFVQNMGNEKRYFQITKGKITELQAKETILKETVQFSNPYTGQEEELLLEIRGLMLDVFI